MEQPVLSQSDRRSGWVTFVALYLGIAGVLNLVWGIAALSNKSYFVQDGLLWSHLNTWGWIMIVVGAVQLAGAGLVAARVGVGVVIAAGLACLGLIVNFLSIGAYPLWSGVLLVIDGLILWAVAAHSDDFILPY